MPSLLYPGRGTTINVSSNNQSGGVTAGQVFTATGGPSPGKKPNRTKKLAAWISVAAAVVALLGFGGYSRWDQLTAAIKGLL